MRNDILARHIYLAIKDDAQAVGRTRAKYLELAEDCLDSAQLLEVTSFTLNGQSGAGELSRNKGELLQLLSLVIHQLDNDAKLSTRTSRVCF